MRQLNRIALVVIFALSSMAAGAQTDPVAEAKAAISRAEYVRAVNLLSAALTQPSPSADAYLYLGIAYAHTREWKRAEDTLRLGAEKFPRDPRFHNELAGVYLAANDLDTARASLRRALLLDPENKYATDLLATIDMSMGNVHAALNAWNRGGHPVVGEVLHNSHVTIENWVVADAMAFQPEEQLTWSKWRTTEARLWESDIFSNVGLEIEPTPVPDRYNAIIRTSEKTNTRRGALINLAVTTVFRKTPTLNWYNVKNSAVNLHSSYRFSTNRHRGRLGVHAPIPGTGPLFLDAQWTWRSEGWDLNPVVREPTGRERFTLKSTGIRTMVSHVPHYRMEVGGGFEYRNRRDESGTSVDRRDTGKFLVDAIFLPMDGRNQMRLRATGFLARRSFLSDMDYSGGTLEVHNRFNISGDKGMLADVVVKAGTSRGTLPIDDYYVLGVRGWSETLLRGHTAITPDGHYGNAPMGTDFVLVNTSFERRVRRLPLFNAINIPYVDLKWEVFMDGGKTFDRARVFQQGKLLVDVGGGFKLEVPGKAIHLIYGRSLRDGTDVFAAYVEKRW